jgi:FMN-dependent NADH-azoreductase
MKYHIKQILIVDVIRRGPASASRNVSQKLSTRLRAKFPEATLVHRDLAKDKLPHLDDGTVKAISSKDPAVVQAHKGSARPSNGLIDDFWRPISWSLQPDVELRDSVIA